MRPNSFSRVAASSSNGAGGLQVERDHGARGWTAASDGIVDLVQVLSLPSSSTVAPWAAKVHGGGADAVATAGDQDHAVFSRSGRAEYLNISLNPLIVLTRLAAGRCLSAAPRISSQRTVENVDEFARVVDDTPAPRARVVVGVDVAVAHRRVLVPGVAAGFDVRRSSFYEQHPRRIDAELLTGQ